jgi:hypothetical protein
MRKRKIVVTESELINSIERIVKEQAAMLGFGNMGGLSLGVSKPTDKYQEMYEDDNTSNTYNVNYMDQSAANQNMEDWEMGEDYELEEYYDDRTWEEKIKDMAKWGNPDNWNKTQQGGGDRELDRELEEDSGAFEDNYFNSIKGIRTSDVYSESRLENLVRKGLLEAQAKEAKKWIQGAVKRPGALRKKLGVGQDKKISLAMINKKMKQIKAKDSNKKVKGVQGLTKADLRTYKQLNLAKSLRKMSKKKHAKEARRYKK